jgi:hypothetical protein
MKKQPRTHWAIGWTVVDSLKTRVTLFRRGILLINIIALVVQFLLLPSSWLTNQEASQVPLRFQGETRDNSMSQELQTGTSGEASLNITVGTPHNSHSIDSSNSTTITSNNSSNNNNTTTTTTTAATTTTTVTAISESATRITENQ